MKKALLALSVTVFCCAANGQVQSPGAVRRAHQQRSVPTKVDAARTAQARASFDTLPLSFEENRGQTDGRVRFMSRGGGYTAFLTDDEVVLALRGSGGSSSASQAALWLRVVGADASSRPAGLSQQQGRINYYVGNDPSRWHLGVPLFGQVSYRNVYPGVDMTYYGNQQQLESDFEVTPGADPRAIGDSGHRCDDQDGSGDLAGRPGSSGGRQLLLRRSGCFDWRILHCQSGVHRVGKHCGQPHRDTHNNAAGTVEFDRASSRLRPSVQESAALFAFADDRSAGTAVGRVACRPATAADTPCSGISSAVPARGCGDHNCGLHHDEGHDADANGAVDDHDHVDHVGRGDSNDDGQYSGELNRWEDGVSNQQRFR